MSSGPANANGIQVDPNNNNKQKKVNKKNVKIPSVTCVTTLYVDNAKSLELN